MQTLESLKKQLDTISELSEMTDALEQIAAREMIKVREKTVLARNFFEATWKIYRVLRGLAPLNTKVRNKSLVVIITPNIGMCGSLISKTLAVAQKALVEHRADALITGRKGQGAFRGRYDGTVHFFSISNEATYEEMEPLKEIVSQYARVHVVFPRYYSTTKQEVELVSLVVSDQPTASTAKGVPPPQQQVLPKRYRVEPNLQAVTDYFVKSVLGMLVYNFFSEALLAYNAAQMVAMHNAHDNAEEMDKKMRFQYHKKRREIIDTKLRELMKPVGF